MEEISKVVEKTAKELFAEADELRAQWHAKREEAQEKQRQECLGSEYLDDVQSALSALKEKGVTAEQIEQEIDTVFNVADSSGTATNNR